MCSYSLKELNLYLNDNKLPTESILYLKISRICIPISAIKHTNTSKLNWTQHCLPSPPEQDGDPRHVSAVIHTPGGLGRHHLARRQGAPLPNRAAQGCSCATLTPAMRPHSPHSVFQEEKNQAESETGEGCVWGGGGEHRHSDFPDSSCPLL